jgi:hypothetical protein
VRGTLCFYNVTAAEQVIELAQSVTLLTLLTYSDYGKVNLSLCLIKDYAMKTYGGVDVWIHIFLNLVTGWR